MKLNIKELLDFFDDKKDSQKGDANALIAMLGEDLNASAYKDFRENKVDILEEAVIQGFQGGKYLDRWILDKKERILFQCEIKNWAATAIGGYQLKSNANEEGIKKAIDHYIKREKKNHLSTEAKYPHPNGVTKVLLKMRPPEEYKNLKVSPLLIYWMPITYDKEGINALSSISIRDLELPIPHNFSELYVFSVSLYLRQLYKKGKGQKFIDLDMPHFEHRIKILTKFQNKK